MLIDSGLNKHYPAACNSWQSRKVEIESNIQHFKQEETVQVKSDEAIQTELSAMLKLAVVQSVTTRFR